MQLSVTAWFRCHFNTAILDAWNRPSRTTFGVDIKTLYRLNSSYDDCFIVFLLVGGNHFAFDTQNLTCDYVVCHCVK